MGGGRAPQWPFLQQRHLHQLTLRLPEDRLPQKQLEQAAGGLLGKGAECPQMGWWGGEAHPQRRPGLSEETTGESSMCSSASSCVHIHSHMRVTQCYTGFTRCF